MQGCLSTNFYPGKCCGRARRRRWLISCCPAELSLLHAKCFLQEKQKKRKHMSQLLILGVTLHFTQTCCCSFCAAANSNTDEKPLRYSHFFFFAEGHVSRRPQPLERKWNIQENECTWQRRKCLNDCRDVYINICTSLESFNQWMFLFAASV